MCAEMREGLLACSTHMLECRWLGLPIDTVFVLHLEAFKRSSFPHFANSIFVSCMHASPVLAYCTISSSGACSCKQSCPDGNHDAKQDRFRVSVMNMLWQGSKAVCDDHMYSTSVHQSVHVVSCYVLKERVLYI